MSNDPTVRAIRKKRIALGMTQSEFYEKVGLSTKTYQRIEQGFSDMRFSQYRSILRALGLTELELHLDSLGVDEISDSELLTSIRLLPQHQRKHIIALIKSIC